MTDTTTTTSQPSMLIKFLGYLVNRLREPSTYAGLAALLVLAHVSVADEVWQNVTTAGIALATLAAAAIPELKGGNTSTTTATVTTTAPAVPASDQDLDALTKAVAIAVASAGDKLKSQPQGA